MNTHTLFSLTAFLSIPVAAVYAAPEQEAAARLQAALDCAYITEVDYAIPQFDSAAQEDAVVLYHYVRKTRRLPAGVKAGSELGQLLKPLLSKKMKLCPRRWRRLSRLRRPPLHGETWSAASIGTES